MINFDHSAGFAAAGRDAGRRAGLCDFCCKRGALRPPQALRAYWLLAVVIESPPETKSLVAWPRSTR